MSGPIAITGATGFIGIHLLNALSREGYEIRALVRRPQPPVKGIAWISGDLDDEAALTALLSGASAVIHAAGIIKALDRNAFFRINEGGTQNLLSVCKTLEDGKRPDRFLLISSLAAREPTLSHYAASKRAAEEWLLAEAGDMPWVIIRPPVVYGPGDTETLKLFRSIKKGIAPIPGCGENRLSLIHVEDLCAAIAAALRSGTALGHILEIDDSTARGYSMDQFIALIETALNVRARRVRIPGFLLKTGGFLNALLAGFIRRPAMFTHLKANEALHPDWVVRRAPADTHLAWRPRIEAENGLKSTVGWYKTKGML